MSIMQNHRFSLDEAGQENARLKVIGIGGGGGNAINNMIAKGLNNVEYIALNTDSQALKNNNADLVIQVGKGLTSGLGAGARPEIGREAIEENRHEIEESIEGADMIFVTAGMGGGTGTGGAPVVAGIAKRKGILTVGVVTTPFECEGRKREKAATEGIKELKKNCDTVIVIPNERLMELCDDDTSLLEAFEKANEVLYNATRGISDLILMPGLINLDFADVRTTMMDGGAAIMGSATSTGADRAEIAARQAISSPLLDGVSIRGARNVLVNISAGSNMGMREATNATKIIQQEAGEDAEIIMGTVLDESFGDELRVTVIATGFEFAEEKNRNFTPGQKAENPFKGTKKPSVDSIESKMVKPSEVTGRLINDSISGKNDVLPYKGKKNLIRLDEPAVNRRPERIVHQIGRKQQAEEQAPSKRTAKTDSNFERIDKKNSDQPAFLRKAMD